MKQPDKPFVIVLDKQLADPLLQLLIEEQFHISHPAYTMFCAKKPDISISLYNSLKLVIQGKNKNHFIEFYLEPYILKSTLHTHPQKSCVDLTPRIGVDEAGKGDYFGPLCVAGVFANETSIPLLQNIGVKDSKSINDRDILRIAHEIKKHQATHVLVFHPPTYNRLYEKFRNLNQLLAWAHATVIESLLQKNPCNTAIIDQFGHSSLVKNAVFKKNISITLIQRHKAEEDIVVAAASIMARAAFLQELKILENKVGLPLPKGATSVIATGKQLVEKFGKDVLSTVGKLHFKTTNQIIETE